MDNNQQVVFPHIYIPDIAMTSATLRCSLRKDEHP